MKYLLNHISIYITVLVAARGVTSLGHIELRKVFPFEHRAMYSAHTQGHHISRECAFAVQRFVRSQRLHGVGDGGGVAGPRHRDVRCELGEHVGASVFGDVGDFLAPRRLGEGMYLYTM